MKKDQALKKRNDPLHCRKLKSTTDFELKIEGDDDLSRDSSETNDSKNDFRITKLDDAYDYPEINSRNKSYAPASYHKDFRSDVKAKIERDPEFLTQLR